MVTKYLQPMMAICNLLALDKSSCRCEYEGNSNLLSLAKNEKNARFKKYVFTKIQN